MIHMALSESEIRSVFDAESHSEVPEYQLVNIRARTRRSAQRGITKQVSLDAFGERYDLNLEKNEDLMADQFDIFYADPMEDGRTSFQRAVEAELLDVGDPYQDREADAALLVHHDPENDALLLDGTVGATLVIRPVPASARPQIDREAEASINDLPPDDEFFLDEEENLQDDRIIEDGFPLHQHHNSSHRVRRRVHKRHTQGLHFVYHRTTPSLKADYGVMEMDALPTGARRRRRRSAPSVIYPEVLIIIDYDGFLLHDQDNNKIKKYFTSFMNGVDLRYKQLRNPEIKVNIAGMIISRGADATPYLEQNKVTADSIDSAAALTAMGKYLFEERRLPTYDIAMAITKHDLCRRRNSGKCTKGTAGFAYVGGACVVNKRLTKVNSVAIVEDTGGFSGIIVAAHELGHLLGNVHDGSPPPSYLGGPGAKRCRWEEGFIMSDLRHTEKGFKWSPCSLEEFDHFLNGETATCLYNAPHERNNLDRHLPGKLLSLDAQCKRDRGTSACFKDDRVCAQLFCFDQATGYCVSYRPAAEGSPCGVGKYCRDGYCVTDDSGGNGFGRISYGSSDFFTSATQTRPVWTDPPTQQTTEKATTKK
ncbi:A disintegrin and metalloproteinase with thrombospondin motifs 8 [Amphibalanus amphitrite]|uniref:A disintegrin and metalloproteinase with thrombospondin motifs 8 n=1 Tax=Amphibalanus amphitrite TaxID=1232801 RepID=A0A6A4VIY3_AMPAM|nr:A disintegrin and metalloproteinase with thrombospondin motifs 8 [Amphibalanus amphitrite]